MAKMGYWNLECDENDIVCPYCGKRFPVRGYEDTYVGDCEVDVYEERDQELTCDNCEHNFVLRPEMTWKYHTETIDGEMTEDEWEELDAEND